MYGPGLAPPPQRPSPAIRVLLRVIFVVVSLFSIGFLCWAALLRVAVVTRKASDWALFWGGVLALVTATVFMTFDDTDDFSSVPGEIGFSMLLLTAFAAIAYYLYADIRHYQALDWAVGAGAAGYHPRPFTQPAYGYPHVQSHPHPGPATVGPIVPQHHAPQHHAPQHHAPQHTPPPHLARQGPYATTSPMPNSQGPGTGIPGTGIPSTGIPGPAHTPAPATPTGPAAPYPGPVPGAPAQSGQPGHGRIDQVRAELDELSDYLRRQSDEPPHSPQESPGSEDGGR